MLLKIRHYRLEGDAILEQAGIDVEYQYSEEANALYKDFLKLSQGKS